jgi:hypothetical protein
LWEKLRYSSLYILLLIACFKDYYLFIINTKNSKVIKLTQKKILLSLLKRNRNSSFGEESAFKYINKVKEYQNLVKINSYADFEPFINKIADGEEGVLTNKRVLALQLSSGSTAASKYLPFTNDLKREFLKGIKPWLFDIICNRPALMCGKMYFSLTPPSIQEHIKKSNIAIGLDDTAYFNHLDNFVLRKLFCVPIEVGKITNILNYKYAILFFLLKEKNLRFISIWNPSFIMFILESLDKWNRQLLNDIEKGKITFPVSINSMAEKKIHKNVKSDKKRAEELKEIFKNQATTSKNMLYKQIWPHLSLISCWTDGNAQLYMQKIKDMFPSVEIQPKGLIATEAFISFPITKFNGSALSINSHFFEFLEIKGGIRDQDTEKTSLAHELECGHKYQIIVTTGGGLYRYNLQDIIEVVGYKNSLPLIRFLGKNDSISDLVGEKINAFHVQKIIDNTIKKFNIKPDFIMLAPEKSNTNFGYTLYFENKDINNNQLEQICKYIEEQLCKNMHYDYCLKLGQLKPLRLYRIQSKQKTAAVTYIERISEHTGAKLGDIKPKVLDQNMFWSTVFNGYYI